MSDATLTIKVEEKEAPEKERDETEETQSETVEAAAAAVALANTVAAQAEIDAARSVAEIEGRMQEKWNAIAMEMEALKLTQATLSERVEFLSSLQIQTEAVAAQALETATEAEKVLTPPPLTDETKMEARDEKEGEKPGSKSEAEPQRKRKLFRL